MKLIPVQFVVLRSLSRLSGNIFLEPEPKFFGLASAPGMLIHIKCFKKPKFFILKFEVEFKNHNFVAIYFKEPFDDHLCL
jgi:hypothetical protein